MILYSPETITFKTNGRGQLTEAISCYVEEERNGKYELEMVYPVKGIHFKDIEMSCIITAKPADGKDPQPFRIYSISKPTDGKCTIKAEHISYQLSHIPVNPFGEHKAVASALQALKANAAEACPFEFWTDKTSSGTFSVKEPKSIRSRLGGEKGSILDAFGGGEYEWDGYTVKLHAHRGSNNGVVLRYGKNITDIEQEKNIENTITGIYPYWKGTDSNKSEIIVKLPEAVMHHQNAANFPYQRTIPLDCSSEFDAQPTESQLRAYATKYMSDSGIGVPKVSIKVSFIALWQTEEYKLIAPLARVNLCDTVTVEFEKLGISAQAKVVRTKFDVLKDRYEEIELGDARTTLSQAINEKVSSASNAAMVQGTSFLKARLTAIEEQLAGATDGYILFDYDANGNRTQILAMDTMDLQTAQNVLTINYLGIGGYSGGYGSQNFHLGITVDGRIVAESIAAGTIMAALAMANVFKVGGKTLGDGSIDVYDANDNLIGKWDKTGLTVYKGLIEGPEIHAGGAGNSNGIIAVYDANGNEIGRWDKDGLEASGNLKIIKDSMSAEIATVSRARVQSAISWYDSLGFTVYQNNVTIKRRFSVFADSDGVEEQIYAEKFKKLFVFFENASKGYAYHLNFTKDSIAMKGYGYGGGTTGTQLDINLSDGTVTVKAGSTGMACDSNGVSQTNGAGHTISVRKSGNYQEIAIGAGATDSYSAPVRVVLSNDSRYSNTYGIHLVAGQNAVNLNGGSSIDLSNGGGLEISNGTFKCSGSVISYNGQQLHAVSSSSRRYKHNIGYKLTKDREYHKLLDLPVAEFVFNDDHPLQYADMRGKMIPGIIAEDVAEIYPSAVIHNEKGQVESWDERRILPGMLALIQEQDKEIKRLREDVEALKKIIEEKLSV